MFRTFSRLFLPNPLDRMLRKTAKRGGRRILIGWNRGLGDIALGLYAIVHRIREFIPNAEVTFLTRENLRDGFSLLEGIQVVTAPGWKRGEKMHVPKTLQHLEFDLVIPNPSPTDWVRWQRGTLVPRLKWDPVHEPLWQKFGLSEEFVYIGVQPLAETQYGLWRNWPYERWVELFDHLEQMQNVKVLLFGYGSMPSFAHSNIVDLRGKTTLFEFLSIVKNRCQAMVLPDSGLLSMIYYLDTSFPIKIVSLWADPDHGILKQDVFSPNPRLRHCPLVGKDRDLRAVSTREVMNRLFPVRPLNRCQKAEEVHTAAVEKTGVILLAGGQGTRLGVQGPKGLFPIGPKNLFQWISEKVPPHIPMAIMTSPLNHDATVAFFESHHHFGRKVFFFEQPLLPFLDAKKRPLPISGPDGNGSVFKAFAASPICSQFEEWGIKYLSIVPVDNPLADPADPILISYLQEKGADVIVKCIEEREADAAMGALVERGQMLEIVEYTELDPTAQYRYRYTGMMAVTLSFLKRAAQIELPHHLVWKQNRWKRECFLFDALPFAAKAEALCYPRAQSYAPLKSLQNLSQVEELLRREKSIIV